MSTCKKYIVKYIVGLHSTENCTPVRCKHWCLHEFYQKYQEMWYDKKYTTVQAFHQFITCLCSTSGRRDTVLHPVFEYIRLKHYRYLVFRTPKRNGLCNRRDTFFKTSELEIVSMRKSFYKLTTGNFNISEYDHHLSSWIFAPLPVFKTAYRP